MSIPPLGLTSRDSTFAGMQTVNSPLKSAAKLAHIQMQQSIDGYVGEDYHLQYKLCLYNGVVREVLCFNDRITMNRPAPVPCKLNSPQGGAPGLRKLAFGF